MIPIVPPIRQRGERPGITSPMRFRAPPKKPGPKVKPRDVIRVKP
jgi:hypothetical protein